MTRRLRLWALVVALAAPNSVAAQAPHATAPAPTLLQGQNRDEPIQIEAATLEVLDKSKTATFSGDVQVVQGDTTIKCPRLVVFYGPEEGSLDGRPVAAAKPAGTPQDPQGQGASGTPQNAQNIRKIEARGGVTVISKDQNASGDLGVYDLRTKLITLTGNVVISQGKNVMHGDRVVVDMITGNARLESDRAAPGRVRALIQPGKGANGNSNVMSFEPNRPN